MNATMRFALPKPKPNRRLKVAARWKRDHRAPILECRNAAHVHCVGCGCPLSVLSGDRPRVSCVRCISENRGLEPDSIDETSSRRIAALLPAW